MLLIARRRGQQALWILGVLLVAAPVFGLEPDEIALVVNANVPDGRAMADLYARERHIPDGRIIEIRLDPDSVISPAEEMPFEAYDSHVATPIRNFLIRNNLQNRVKCLVTFWGVPLRIARHTRSPAERDEYANVTREFSDTRTAIAQDVSDLELSAAQLDPTFKPQKGDELPRLSRRLDLAINTIARLLPTIKDAADRNVRYSQFIATTQRLLGTDRTTQLMAQPAVALFSPHPPSEQDLTEARARLTDVEREIAGSQSETATPFEREKARTLAHDSLGLFGYIYLLVNQEAMLSTDQSEAALDSELALLWWHDYPRARWVTNQLHWQAPPQRDTHRETSPVLMVTRLDGPSLDVVRNIILTSVKVEAQGLHGQVAIDARGRTAKNDAYAEYDQKLRDLADLLSKKTKLKVTLDNTEALFAPHSVPDIAIYCGWYSLRNYSSPGTFSPGAVGYHIASFELLSLRRPKEHGWVRGLLSEGVVGTLGPVAEPYLQSFPLPDEFFPLLMTGKLTLAEVYWRTVPWASWMQTCIGDPLYNPYKNDPPLQVDDLPTALRGALTARVFNSPATQPATISAP